MMRLGLKALIPPCGGGAGPPWLAGGRRAALSSFGWGCEVGYDARLGNTRVKLTRSAAAAPAAGGRSVPLCDSPRQNEGLSAFRYDGSRAASTGAKATGMR